MCCTCAGTCNHTGNHWFCTAHGGSVSTRWTDPATNITIWNGPVCPRCGPYLGWHSCGGSNYIGKHRRTD